MVTTIELPDFTCSAYGKRTGVFVSSGLLAVESALCLAGLVAGSLVLIPRLCCWKVAVAVLRAGCRPVVCDVNDNLTLDTGRAIEVASRLDVRAIIAVHHLGFPADVAALAGNLSDDLVLIEDAAQAWELLGRGSAVGEHSDYVTTSFGETKPYSLGFGGGVFFDDVRSLESFSLDFAHQLTRTAPPLPYGLASPGERTLFDACRGATRLMAARRATAKIACAKLDDLAGVRSWKGFVGDQPCWHRIPAFFRDEPTRDRFADLANRFGLSYQVPYQYEIDDIPFLRHVALRECVAPLPTYLLLYATEEVDEKLGRIALHWAGS
jgi:dTDP-4-amino-4,6-dideoxygalactose transaminase